MHARPSRRTPSLPSSVYIPDGSVQSAQSSPLPLSLAAFMPACFCCLSPPSPPTLTHLHLAESESASVYSLPCAFMRYSTAFCCNGRACALGRFPPAPRAPPSPGCPPPRHHPLPRPPRRQSWAYSRTLAFSRLDFLATSFAHRPSRGVPCHSPAPAAPPVAPRRRPYHHCLAACVTFDVPSVTHTSLHTGIPHPAASWLETARMPDGLFFGAPPRSAPPHQLRTVSGSRIGTQRTQIVFLPRTARCPPGPKRSRESRSLVLHAPRSDGSLLCTGARRDIRVILARSFPSVPPPRSPSLATFIPACSPRRRLIPAPATSTLSDVSRLLLREARTGLVRSSCMCLAESSSRTERGDAGRDGARDDQGGGAHEERTVPVLVFAAHGDCGGEDLLRDTPQAQLVPRPREALDIDGAEGSDEDGWIRLQRRCLPTA
ncbi:hypothetical protein DFH06DRAFT_1327431 [Mycena polygramma]|nr:hypothetical protein DFH06DRAFT_1327431 [Mycena polygramma]